MEHTHCFGAGPQTMGSCSYRKPAFTAERYRAVVIGSSYRNQMPLCRDAHPGDV